jgi:hypothetical protein
LREKNKVGVLIISVKLKKKWCELKRDEIVKEGEN